MPQQLRSLSLLAAIAITVRSAPARAQTADVPLVVSTQWVSSHADDRRLVIVAVGMNRAGYDSAHIRGAQFLPYGAFVHPQDGLTTELPPLVALDSALESVGISNDSRIVIYGPPVISHRLFLALDVTGLRGQVGMLDGGLDAWGHDGGAVVSGAPAAVRAGRLVLTPRSDVLVDRAWVRDHVRDPGYQFVDARGRGFEQGHLPDAVHVPAPSLVIRIASRGAGARLEIEIADDGPGMDDNHTAPPGVGLANTVGRLGELYGSAFDLDIRSMPGATIARISFPAMPIAPALRSAS